MLIAARAGPLYRRAVTLPSRPCRIIKDYLAFTKESLRAAVTEYLGWVHVSWTGDEAAFREQREGRRRDLERRHGKMNTWDVSRVTDMSYLFCWDLSWGGPWLDADISAWDTSSVTTMRSMFAGRSGLLFQQDMIFDISAWDTSSVTDMSFMFSNQRHFNADLSNWDTSSVTKVDGMFNNCSSFNADLRKWDMSALSPDRFQVLFDGADAFDRDFAPRSEVFDLTRGECYETDSSSDDDSES